MAFPVACMLNARLLGLHKDKRKNILFDLCCNLYVKMYTLPTSYSLGWLLSRKGKKEGKEEGGRERGKGEGERTGRDWDGDRDGDGKGKGKEEEGEGEGEWEGKGKGKQKGRTRQVRSGRSEKPLVITSTWKWQM